MLGRSSRAGSDSGTIGSPLGHETCPGNAVPSFARPIATPIVMPPSSKATEPASGTRVSTGIVGLDAILGGGFPANHLYLVECTPGTGKTTLALQFLLAGAA